MKMRVYSLTATKSAMREKTLWGDRKERMQSEGHRPQADTMGLEIHGVNEQSTEEERKIILAQKYEISAVTASMSGMQNE